MAMKKQVFVNLQQLPISLKLQPLFRVKEMQFDFFFLPVETYLFLFINVSHDIICQHIIYVVLNLEVEKSSNKQTKKKEKCKQTEFVNNKSLFIL